MTVLTEEVETWIKEVTTQCTRNRKTIHKEEVRIGRNTYFKGSDIMTTNI